MTTTYERTEFDEGQPFVVTYELGKPGHPIAARPALTPQQIERGASWVLEGGAAFDARENVSPYDPTSFAGLCWEYGWQLARRVNREPSKQLVA